MRRCCLVSWPALTSATRRVLITLVPAYTAALSGSLKGLRVGIVRQHFDEGLDEQTGAAVKDALAVLESQGAILTEVDLPNLDLCVPTYYVVAPAECSSNLSRFDGVRFGHRAKDPQDSVRPVLPQSRRRLRRGSEAPHHDRYLCVVGWLLRRVLSQGAKSPRS